MSIYAYKNSIMNSLDFLNNVNQKDFIDGFILHATMTKDNKIISYTPTTANLSTEALQASTLEALEGTTMEELSKLLQRMDGFKKKIIIYVMPLITPQLSDDTVQQINARNWLYIENLKEILLPFKNLKINITSPSRVLVKYMKQQINFLPIGRNISPIDLNYQEANFFILPPSMLDAKIIKQELERGTELLIEMITADDMALVFQFFGGTEENTQEEIFQKLHFISAYPNLFYTTFKEKGLFS